MKLVFVPQLCRFDVKRDESWEPYVDSEEDPSDLLERNIHRKTMGSDLLLETKRYTLAYGRSVSAPAERKI